VARRRLLISEGEGFGARKHDASNRESSDAATRMTAVLGDMSRRPPQSPD
jgi:hypothetical protein